MFTRPISAAEAAPRPISACAAGGGVAQGGEGVLARGGEEALAVVEQLGEGGRHAVGEDHGGGEHRAGERAAPGFVHAGDPAALAETGLEFEMRWCHAALLSARLASLHSGVDRLRTKCGVRAAARGS